MIRLLCLYYTCSCTYVYKLLKMFSDNDNMSLKKSYYEDIHVSLNNDIGNMSRNSDSVNMSQNNDNGNMSRNSDNGNMSLNSNNGSISLASVVAAALDSGNELMPVQPEYGHQTITSHVSRTSNIESHSSKFVSVSRADSIISKHIQIPNQDIMSHDNRGIMNQTTETDSCQYSHNDIASLGVNTLQCIPRSTTIFNSFPCVRTTTINNKQDSFQQNLSENYSVVIQQACNENIQHSEINNQKSVQQCILRSGSLNNPELDSDYNTDNTGARVKKQAQLTDAHGRCVEVATDALELHYKCGGCTTHYGTICELHEHLQEHDEGGSYHYDHHTRTAFPKYDTVCSSAQTESKVVNVMKVNKKTLDLKRVVGMSKRSVNKYINHEFDKNKKKAKHGINLNGMKMKHTKAVHVSADSNATLVKGDHLHRNQTTSITNKSPYRKKNGKFCKRLRRNPIEMIKVAEAIEARRLLEGDVKEENGTSCSIKNDKLVNSVVKRLSTYLPTPKKRPRPSYMGLGDGDYDGEGDDYCRTEVLKSKSKSTMTKKAKHLVKKRKRKESALKNEDLASYINAESDNTEEVSVMTEPLKEIVENAYEMSIQHMCFKCNFIFSSDAFLGNHMLRHQGQYPCDICFFSFPTLDQLDSHMCKDGNIFEMTNIEIEYCHYCEKVFTELTGLKAHVCVDLEKDNKEVQVIRPFPENSSGQHALMKYLPGVKTEKDKDETEETVECQICRKIFENSCVLYTHSFVHRYPYKCSNCEMVFVSESAQIEHELICIIGQRYPCSICKKSFTTQSYLNCHVQIHQGIKNYQCEKCGQAFVRATYLSRHIKSCMDPVGREKAFQCDVCQKKFFDRNTLHVHRSTVHSDQRLFVCEVCGSTFKYANALKKHGRVHMAERPVLNCDKCDATFHAVEGLRRHQKRHSQQCKEQCSICGKSFYEKWNMKAHMRQHTGEKPYKCDVCGQGFTHNISRKKHMQNYHAFTRV